LFFELKKFETKEKWDQAFMAKIGPTKPFFFQFVKAAFASTTPHFYFTYYQQKKNLRKLNVPH
jgi:hypothetical protein